MNISCSVQTTEAYAIYTVDMTAHLSLAEVHEHLVKRKENGRIIVYIWRQKILHLAHT